MNTFYALLPETRGTFDNGGLPLTSESRILNTNVKVQRSDLRNFSKVNKLNLWGSSLDKTPTSKGRQNPLQKESREI